MERFESQFPAEYRKDDIAKICSFVQQGRFCQLICPPGGGKATVLKSLVNNQHIRLYHLEEKAETVYFLYLNLLELPDFTESSIYKFLLTSLRFSNKTMQQSSNDPVMLSQALKDTIDERTNKKQQTLVFLLDHFDEYQNHLSRSFFQMLRTLKSLAKYRFSVVFATRRNLRELVDQEILKEFYDFFVDNTVYMQLSDYVASSFMIGQLEKIARQKLEQKEKDELLRLTGGHTKLLKVCIETVLQEKISITIENLLQKRIVRAALYELWLFLTPQEQQSLIKNSGENILLTIPLFAAFVRDLATTVKVEHLSFKEQTKEILKGETVISDLLSAQEFRLLQFFIQNPNRIVEREEIITAVWKETKTISGVTEAALDQLIFRLRHKIEDDPNNPKHLQTVKGRGFRFSP